MKLTLNKKSRIRETPTLSTDADSRINTNLKRFRDLSFFPKVLFKYVFCFVFSSPFFSFERPRKKLRGKGTSDTQTHRQTDRRTCRLSDQLGPEGRVGEAELVKINPQQNDNAGNIIHQQITEIQVPNNQKTQLQQKPQVCK